MNKHESRYFRTAVKMDEALLSLLEKKDFAYITVKELCREANVSRSTFYLHYETMAELLEEVTRYLLDKHLAYYALDIDRGVAGLRGKHKHELVFITNEYLRPYLTFIKENRRVFKVALDHFHTMNMNRVYDRMFRNIFDPILTCFEVPDQERPFVIKFYLKGVFGVITQWLDGDCQEDIAFIVKVINDCVLGARRL